MTKKQDATQERILQGLEALDAKVDRLRTEDVPGIHTKIALLEANLSTLKENVRAEAKRDARIYGGIGSAVATLIAIAMAIFRR